MSQQNIDLHTHTHYSDGTSSPTELVREAAEAGLCAIAVTDHDTTDGIAEAVQAGTTFGIEVVPGVEISAQYPQGILHILGYYIDPENEFLQQKLQSYIHARNQRNPKILERLTELGFPMQMEEVEAIAQGQVINRPHIAQAMLDKGYVKKKQEAFDRFLGHGAAAFVPKEVFTPEESIRIIHQAGGLAVLAHPDQLDVGNLPDTLKEIRRMKELGIDGVEAYHGSGIPDNCHAYEETARELGLFVTGGSDYHGERKQIRLGRVSSLERIPYSFLETMKQIMAGRN